MAVKARITRPAPAAIIIAKQMAANTRTWLANISTNAMVDHTPSSPATKSVAPAAMVAIRFMGCRVPAVLIGRRQESLNPIEGQTQRDKGAIAGTSRWMSSWSQPTEAVGADPCPAVVAERAARATMASLTTSGCSRCARCPAFGIRTKSVSRFNPDTRCIELRSGVT